jgi:hypothetical protein
MTLGNDIDEMIAWVSKDMIKKDVVLPDCRMFLVLGAKTAFA